MYYLCDLLLWASISLAPVQNEDLLWLVIPVYMDSDCNAHILCLFYNLMILISSESHNFYETIQLIRSIRLIGIRNDEILYSDSWVLSSCESLFKSYVMATCSHCCKSVRNTVLVTHPQSVESILLSIYWGLSCWL